MTAKCQVTFEFDSRPPRTWNGEVEGGSAATLARRAIDAANKQLRPRSWVSFTCVILEREGFIDDPVEREEDIPLPIEDLFDK